MAGSTSNNFVTCDMSLAIIAKISVSSIRLQVQTQLLIERLSTSDFTIQLNWSYR